MERTSVDYRTSHLDPDKGEKYERRFSETPHRALMWELEKAVLEEIVRERYNGRPIHLLDFACGTGRILRFLEPYVSSAVGVDVSPSMLAIARRESRHATIIEADLTRNGALGDRKFNLITAFRFFPNAQPALRKEAMAALVRHLAPDGCIVFNNHLNSASLFVAALRVLRIAPRMGMSHTEVESLVSDAGLRISTIRHMGLLPSNDRLLLLPLPIVRAVERWAAQRSALRRVCQNLVYVCERNDTTGSV